MQTEINDNYRVLSLFSGGGGLDLGFEQAGFEHAALVDHDPAACATLRQNRPAWPVFEVDVRDFNPTGLGSVDGVIGGPPCQGFSNAGSKNPDDPRNFLWRAYMRVVGALRPAFVLLENVPSLLLPRNQWHVTGIVTALGIMGYQVDYAVRDAADFGVAQRRPRLFFLGIRDHQAKLPEAPNISPRSVQDALHGLNDDLPNTTSLSTLRRLGSVGASCHRARRTRSPDDRDCTPTDRVRRSGRAARPTTPAR